MTHPAPRPTPFPQEVADAYLAVWNEADDSRRRALLDQSWAETARYVDPLMTGEGRAGIATIIEATRAQFPGHHFALRGTPDGHGVHVRFSWTLASADGDPVAGGTDVVRFDPGGRIAEVVGFLNGGAA